MVQRREPRSNCIALTQVFAFLFNGGLTEINQLVAQAWLSSGVA